MLIPSLPHMHFFHFSYTCYLGSNGSIKVLESTIVFDSFWRAILELVLECYGSLILETLTLKISSDQIWVTSYFG
jgi:hypothetical protein